GNTVVLKPSTESAVSGGLILAQIFEQAGLPKGVLNVVTNGPGKSSEIGDVFVKDKRVRRITFTGSTEVGRILAEKAGNYLKKVTLELGCSSPLIVLKDADIEYAVNAAVFGWYLHQGQVCMSTKRIIVEKEIAEKFTEEFIRKVKTLKAGDPRSNDIIVGPLINENQRNKLLLEIERAIEQGAKLIYGGDYKGLVFYPTVLTGVTEDMDIFYEETFGPVASIIVADNAEEALRLANNCDYGLSAGIITANVNKGIELAEKLEFGCTHINGATVHDESHVPFGGMKDSGWGRNGIEAIEEYTEIRWVTLQKDKISFKF
ncbi:MAG: aldehyde dehydrogenase family protein, partial [Clostridiales bacterium]|nr:aldehyde dehydrogenase family protein [Clostridiales bacterium]